jgi:hypothetical protein
MRPPGGAQSAGRPCRPPWPIAADPIQQPIVRAVSVKGTNLWMVDLREWGRRRGRRPFSDPDPSDRFGC